MPQSPNVVATQLLDIREHLSNGGSIRLACEQLLDLAVSLEGDEPTTGGYATSVLVEAR